MENFIDSILLDTLEELEIFTAQSMEKISLSEHLAQSQEDDILTEQALLQIQKILQAAS